MTDEPQAPSQKPARKMIYAAGGLSAGLIGYVVAVSEPGGALHVAAQEGAFYTIWIGIAGLAIGNTRIGELVGLALGRWLGPK